MDWIEAGWRLGKPEGIGSDDRPHVLLEAEPNKTLFETIEQSGLPDERTYVLDRSSHSFAIMNVFPYTNGHLMVLPRVAVARMDQLDDAQYVDLWAMVRHATSAIERAINPDGLNVGLNQGRAAGASQPDHLHVHVVPRWAADTSFITTAAGVRVLPVPLVDMWRSIRAEW